MLVNDLPDLFIFIIFMPFYDDYVDAFEFYKI